ncbi:hypothetical protein GCM10008934_17620 [Virgibacillus salarius]
MSVLLGNASVVVIDIDFYFLALIKLLSIVENVLRWEKLLNLNAFIYGVEPYQLGKNMKLLVLGTEN